MKTKNKLTIAERAAAALNLPAEAISNVTQIEITGTGCVYIERHNGIIEYGNREIRVDCGRHRTRIYGEDLQLKAMNNEELLITGQIFGLEFEF